ncbi:hypothetical protein GCM10007874_37070 [Labrys miyagiensis]|uniref:Uncharacterized protein n=2 Tax=Labrys miyagiensis TaxID=346912 RepID=A0ABQ6CKJ9_9HYPH|nr:hypothetical protein GCM10007874_37070 [Labrys miyagiensis]
MISTSFAASAASLLPCGATTPQSVCAFADPAIRAWEEWQTAQGKTLALCRKQQRLETRLQRTVGMPYAVVVVPDALKLVRISSAGELDRLIKAYPAVATKRNEVMARLTAHHERWNEADRAIGYSVALHEEELAMDREQELADRLWSTPASSLAGIGAKLAALIHSGEPSEECAEFPWPQIRSALADLRRLSQTGTFVQVRDEGQGFKGELNSESFETHSMADPVRTS